jgi:hypothetical protein
MVALLETTLADPQLQAIFQDRQGIVDQDHVIQYLVLLIEVELDKNHQTCTILIAAVAHFLLDHDNMPILHHTHSIRHLKAIKMIGQTEAGMAMVVEGISFTSNVM